MIITLNITEDSKVELVRDNCEAVQRESNVTIFKLNFPQSINGYPTANYTKQIEFGECKKLGECVKFFDIVEGDEYKLCDICTQFKKVMVQFTLTNTVDAAEPIIWKTIPFALEFAESINAEASKQAQATLLSLNEILVEWENYIKANTLRIIHNAGDVAPADANAVGDLIFYLGANATSPYVLEYGHYYQCTLVNGVYSWTDLTSDPVLGAIAGGVRDLGTGGVLQFATVTADKMDEVATQDGVLYIPEDLDPQETFFQVLTEMSENEKYNIALPVREKDAETGEYTGVLEYNGGVLPLQKLIFDGGENGVVIEGANEADNIVSAFKDIFTHGEVLLGKTIKMLYQFKWFGGGTSSFSRIEERVFRLANTMQGIEINRECNLRQTTLYTDTARLYIKEGTTLAGLTTSLGTNAASGESVDSDSINKAILTIYKIYEVIE